MTVPPTPAGVATAVTAATSALETTRPRRSHPDWRSRPPEVRVGGTERVPDVVADAVPETDLTLAVPDTFDAALTTAPLAYYLGAEMVVEERTAPVLRAPTADCTLSLPAGPDLHAATAATLRKLFFLDCLARDDALSAHPTVTEHLPADPSELRTLSPAARLEAYLDVPDDVVAPLLPEWHLSTYVDPGPDAIDALPAIFDRLSLVYRAESTAIDRADLLDQTLGDAYTVRGHTSDATVVDPELGVGRVHAWLGSGAPVEGFKTTPSALRRHGHSGTGLSANGGASSGDGLGPLERCLFGGRTPERVGSGARRSRDDGPLSVAVVLNDDAMAGEHRAVADIYREAAGVSLDVDVHETVPRARLAELFETEHDFLHYIGHCEAGGLACPDGELSVESLEATRTRTFFLNACGSYDEGLALVENGAIAGGVTFRSVLDRQAARVGTTFARLLVHGFGFERALQLARRRILMGKDYAVVGDGTYALLPSPEPPVVGHLDSTADGRYELTCEVLDASANGDRYDLPVTGTAALNGQAETVTLDADQLTTVLEDVSMPLVYDGDVTFAADLREGL